MDPNQQTSPPLTTQVQPVPLPVVPKPKRPWFMYLGIGIIALMFLGTFGPGAYILSQRDAKNSVAATQDASVSASSESAKVNNFSATVDVSSWKTLESRACSLSLKYPSLLTAKDGEFACSVVIGDAKTGNYALMLLGQSAKQSPSDASGSAQTYLTKFYNQNPSGMKEIVVGGMKGYEASANVANNTAESLQFSFGEGSTIFFVNAQYLKTDEHAKELSESIVSTIKLTGNPEDTLKPSDLIDKVVTSFSQANNTKRRSDVNTYLNAVQQYAADNQGVLPEAITITAQEISNAGADICQQIFPDYIAAMASDPLVNKGISSTTCTNYSTGYQILKDASNKVTVFAPMAELGETVSVTR